MPLEGWKAFFEIGGVVLLLLTFAFGAGALIVNNRLNAIQAKELGDFKIKFEGEQQKTALAQKEAAEAKEIAGGFERDISIANQRASDAKAAQQRVEIEMAKQQERAAIAERALLQLSESLKDRAISPAQHKILVEALRGAPSGAVDIWWTASDTDSFGLAKQMVEIFKEAGWPPATEHFAAGGTGSGFFIAVRDNTNAPAYAVSIQKAYKLIGIDMNGFSKADVPEGQVQIYIGHKTPRQ